VPLYWYFNISALIYCFAFFSIAAVSYFILKSDRIINFFISFLACEIFYIVITFCVIKLGIIHQIFQLIVGNEYGRMSAGAGFGILFLYFFAILSNIIGAIIAFFRTYFNKNKIINQ
jgi:hypothetical protein